MRWAASSPRETTSTGGVIHYISDYVAGWGRNHNRTGTSGTGSRASMVGVVIGGDLA
jgi:uncharacterized protein YqgC (DUF456 family)